jgi:hypothetical protein
MKKMVNGKIVDINNINLFETAIEDTLNKDLAVNDIENDIPVEAKTINKFLKYYRTIYKALPFPLYLIENNVKYAAIGTFIKLCLKDEILDIWVDNALYILLDSENSMALKFVDKSWSIVEVTDDIEKGDINLENYKDCIGYKEFNWFLDTIINKNTNKNFYQEFMKDFADACNNDSLIMQWELSNILNFGYVPDSIKLKENRILNFDRNSELFLDIYFDRMVKTGEREHVVSNIVNESTIRYKYEKIYNFECYEKVYEGSTHAFDGNPQKIKKSDIKGMEKLFRTLYIYKIMTGANEFENYKGLIKDGDMVFQINNRLYCCKAYKDSEVKEIAQGVQFHTYDRGIVYFKKSFELKGGARKELIYSYSIRDGLFRLCRIQFIKTDF